MARKVFISSDMSIDEAVSEVAESNPVAALIWPWILTCFDDWGRAKASPREIKNSVFPANDLINTDTIGEAITLYGIKLVHLYEVDSKPYMCIDPDKWFKYQTHIRREKRENDGSKHPAPNALSSAQVRASARDIAESRADLTDCIPSPSPSPSLSPSLSKTQTNGVSVDSQSKIREWLMTYKVECRGTFQLERVISFIGTMEIQVIEHCIKLSEGKSVPYLETVIQRHLNEGKTTKESIRVVRTGPGEREAELQQRMADERKNNVVEMIHQPDPVLGKVVGND